MRVTVTPEQIRTAFEAVKDDPSFDESRGLWERGLPPVEMLQAMCLRPEILRAFAGFGDCVYPGGLLERRVKELVIITASQTNECQFCENSHCDLVDIDGHHRRATDAHRRPERAAPRERLAVEYTRAAMPDSNHVPEPLMTELHASVQRPRAGRAVIPDRLHQHAQPVQQPARRSLPRRVQPARPCILTGSLGERYLLRVGRLVRTGPAARPRGGPAGTCWRRIHMPPTPEEHALLLTLEPEAAKLLDRHLKVAQEWFPHDYIPYPARLISTRRRGPRTSRG